MSSEKNQKFNEDSIKECDVEMAKAVNDKNEQKLGGLQERRKKLQEMKEKVPNLPDVLVKILDKIYNFDISEIRVEEYMDKIIEIYGSNDCQLEICLEKIKEDGFGNDVNKLINEYLRDPLVNSQLPLHESGIETNLVVGAKHVSEHGEESDKKAKELDNCKSQLPEEEMHSEKLMNSNSKRQSSEQSNKKKSLLPNEEKSPETVIDDFITKIYEKYHKEHNEKMNKLPESTKNVEEDMDASVEHCSKMINNIQELRELKKMISTLPEKLLKIVVGYIESQDLKINEMDKFIDNIIDNSASETSLIDCLKKIKEEKPGEDIENMIDEYLVSIYIEMLPSELKPIMKAIKERIKLQCYIGLLERFLTLNKASKIGRYVEEVKKLKRNDEINGEDIENMINEYLASIYIKMLPSELKPIMEEIKKSISLQCYVTLLERFLSLTEASEIEKHLKEVKKVRMGEKVNEEITTYLESEYHKCAILEEKASKLPDGIMSVAICLINEIRGPKNGRNKEQIREIIEYILEKPDPTKTQINILKELEKLSDLYPKTVRAIKNYLPKPTVFDTDPLPNYILNKHYSEVDAGERIEDDGAYNVLIIGQSGVGKSTLLNGLKNYLLYESAEDALAGKFEFIIPASFHVYNRNNDRISITVGKDLNERFIDENDSQAGSRTQSCRVYPLEYKGTRINFIDTPGLSDTRGMDQDKLNLRDIYQAVLMYKKIDKICLVIQTNTSKYDAYLQNAVSSLFSIFPKSAMPSFIYCMTFARGNFYRPGDVLNVIKKISEEYKQKRGVDLPKVSKDSIFCFDNEAFKFLCFQHQKIEYCDLKLEDYKKSWEKSRENALRFIEKLPESSPTDTKVIKSIQEKRMELTELYKKLDEYSYLQDSEVFKEAFREYKEKSKELDEIEMDQIGRFHSDYSKKIK